MGKENLMAKYNKLTGIYLSDDMHHNAKVVAAKKNLSLSEYIRGLIVKDEAYQKQKEM